ncbi:hypothetical protein [Streptomyces antimycoticus]|nr:hypothetical protein OG751_23075 [Streptomyces antimycoticus]
MTDHDIQMLTIGFTIGLYVMLAVQILGGMLDDRRDRRCLEAARQRADR